MKRPKKIHKPKPKPDRETRITDLDPAIARIRAERGLAVRVAEALGIERAAVYQWRRVPSKRVLEVAEIIGMTPKHIRPDVFGRFRL